MKCTKHKKIKLLIISRTIPYLGGREIIVDKLIKHFAKNKVSIITPDNYLYKKNKKNINIFNTNKSFDHILSWAKKQDINLINCHTFYLANLAIFLSKKLNIPLVFTLHGIFVDYYGKKYGSLLKKIYNNSNIVITVSDEYKKKLSKFLRCSEKIIVIKNGINIKDIDKLKGSKEYYRKKNKLPINKSLIIIPARLNYLKGLDYLIKAINEIRSSNYLFIICSPSGRKNKNELVYRNKLKNNLKDKKMVIFKNINNYKLFEHYKAADMIVLPSIIEGISISILEAMAVPLPVITTKVGGNPEIIENKKNGVLITPKNSKEIIRGIKIMQKINLTKLKHEARKTIKNKFTENRMLKNYNDIFLKLIN